MTQYELPKEIRMGLGCMGMSQWYGQTDDLESIKTINEALDKGISYLDTAEVYGPFTNEELIGKAIKTRRDDAYIATKFGFPMIQSDGTQIPPDSSAKNIRRSVEASLKRLQTDYIDLLYQHRIDRNIPIEDVINTMAELVKEGKVRHIGLCEVGCETIRRANLIHPLTAVQAEYSIWERNLEEEILPLLKELNIALLAFCPLGRGYLTNNGPKPSELYSTDFRKLDPRFEESNYSQNYKFLNLITKYSEQLKITPAQLALSWILTRTYRIIPIPGTKRRKYLNENISALNIQIPDDILANFNNELDTLVVSGERYNKTMLNYIDR